LFPEWLSILECQWHNGFSTMMASHPLLTPSSPRTPPRQRFTAYEDALLRSLVCDGPPKNWKAIALHFPGKTTRQCRDRYKNYLCQDHHLVRNWTAIEDLTIEQAQLTFGHQWAIIARLLPGRRCVDVKNRWYHHLVLRKGPRTFQDELEADRNRAMAEAGSVVRAPEFPLGPREIGDGLFVWNNVVGRQLEAEE
jgi:hypothetical protein